MANKYKVKKKTKKINGNTQRGVAVAIHNAVLNKLQETQQELTKLTQILGCHLLELGAPIHVDLVDTPGNWIIDMSESNSIKKGVRCFRLELINLDEKKKEIEALDDDVVLAPERA